MKYPMTKNWLVFEKVRADEYRVWDHLEQRPYTVKAALAEFAMLLDGKTDPYNTDYPASPQRIREMLGQLKKEGLLREKTYFRDGALSIFKTLWIPKERESTRTFSYILNAALLLLWMPVLVSGIVMVFDSRGDMDRGYWAGFIFGIISGLFFHEFAHGAATLGYGGDLFEMGVMIRYLMPGAYVLINVEGIKNKFRRIQVYAAGVEMNFFLAGLYFILASCIPPLYAFFYLAGINNVCLGVINLMLLFGVDGMAIANEMMGSCNTVLNAYLLLTEREYRRAILSRGVNGVGVLLSSALVGVGQLAFPVFILLNFLEVISLV